MGGGETYAHVGHGAGDGAEQLGEKHGLSVGGIETVGIDVLAEECHLATTMLLKVADFGQNALHVAAAFTATGIGDNAVMAEIVAASHNADKAAYFGTMEALGHDIAVGFGQRKLDVDGLVPHFGLGNEVGK